MDHALVVRVGHGLGDRDHRRDQRQPLVERVRRGDRRRQRPPLDPLHRVGQDAVLIEPEVVDRDDVGMDQAAGDPRLAQEARRQPGVRVAQLLHRHVAIEHDVVGGPHRGQAALGQHRAQLVALGEARRRQRDRRGRRGERPQRDGRFGVSVPHRPTSYPSGEALGAISLARSGPRRSARSPRTGSRAGAGRSLHRTRSRSCRPG